MRGVIAALRVLPGSWGGCARVVVGVAVSGVACGVLLLLDADLAVAVLGMLGAVVVVSFLGLLPALASALSAFFLLTYFFTHPASSLRVDRVDDLVALLAFLGVAVGVSTVVTRLNVLRTRAEAATVECLRLAGLSRAAEVQRELDRSRVGFLSTVTHDVRTPIATVRAALATLRRSGSIAGRDRELLEAAYAETVRLDDLIAKVMELSRIKSGAVEAEVTMVEVADAVRAALGQLDKDAVDDRVEVDVVPPTLTCVADPVLLDHVVRNLVENALQYARDRVLVHARCRDGDAEIRVVDHGPGIGRADRARVFDEFVRIVPSCSNTRGSGLGLAVVRGLLDAIGGRVWYEETEGGGATFVVALAVGSHEAVA
jgi:two-component system, OmpR family, sensor histidine kinase KdpD